MGFLGPFFWVVILLGVMILIHELGHFWAALSVGVKVETFSIGFGPRLFGFRRGETDFRISAIPFGGYVRMFGEQPGEETAADPRAFQSKARWQRAIVIIAGPLMNVLLAVGLVTGLYMYGFPKESPSSEAVISSVANGSPAEVCRPSLGRPNRPDWRQAEPELAGCSDARGPQCEPSCSGSGATRERTTSFQRDAPHGRQRRNRRGGMARRRAGGRSFEGLASRARPGSNREICSSM